MPRDTNGTYTPPSNNASPAVALTPIRSADFNALMSDMQDALNTNPPTQAQTSTDNAAVRFNGTTGGTQNSGLIIDDNNNVSGAKTIVLSGSASGTTTVAPAAAASGTLTLPAATDTLVGKATTDTLTNKTFDTAGTGNSLSINGLAATANTGTGAVVRASSPTLTTPNIGAANGSSLFLNGNLTLGGSAPANSYLFFNNNTATAALPALGVNNTDNTLYIYSRGAGGISLQSAANAQIGTIADNGDTNIKSTTASSSSTTGALKVAGGVGVAGALNVGGAATVASVNKVTITAPATSATLTIPDGVTFTGPAASGTAMTLGNAETVSGAKSFNSGTVILKGSSSGTTTVNASAAASGTLTLPAATDTLVGRATSDTLSNKIIDTANTNALKVNGNVLIASAGTANVTVPNSTTTLVGRDTTDTLTNKTLGLTTLSGGLQATVAPAIQINESWFGAGATAKTHYDHVFASSDTARPTLGTHITVDHQVGGSSPYTVFGMSDFRAVVGRAAGGNIYGLNMVMHADTGFNKLLQGIEVDVNNNSGTDAGGVGTSNAQYAMTVAGSGPNKITAPFFLTGGGNGGAYLAKYGVTFDSKAVSDYLIYNTSSSSPNSLFTSSGAHQYGLNWHGASFSTAWATVPNNAPLQALNAAGNTLLNILKLTNADRIDVGDASHATNIVGPLQIGGNTFGYTPPTTWTPALTGTGGGPPTYGVRVGYYVQIGPLIVAFFYFTTTALNGLSGNLTIAGLPVASANNTNDRGILAFGGYDGISAGAGQTQIGGFIAPNTTSITLVSSSATGSAGVSVTGAMLAAASTIFGIAIYHT